MTKEKCYKLLDRAYWRLQQTTGNGEWTVAYNTKLIATIQEQYPLWFEDYQIEKSMK